MKTTKYDIEVSGQMGFYQIVPQTDKGKDWMMLNLDDANTPWHGVYCDDTRITSDITDAAFAEGLRIAVNGHKYIGKGRVAE